MSSKEGVVDVGPEEGDRLKDKENGEVFNVKLARDGMVVLVSEDGLSQRMMTVSLASENFEKLSE
jgi:hypothetical protein